jgi:Spy/CpxP family protein refolding chaperone
MKSLLNLTAEQKDKMRELRNRHHAATRDLRYDLAQKRLEMRRLFTDPKTSDQVLLAKEREISALRQKLFDTRAQMKIEWRSILTPEQIQKLDEVPHRGRGHGFVAFGQR